ncbi:polyketide synthase [Sesbania bispinosa]|nr:polyketide synthase [Sesbania bispinosa]KAJ1419505.1 polyketide synthase [Sesbania bispinosa]
MKEQLVFVALFDETTSDTQTEQRPGMVAPVTNQATDGWLDGAHYMLISQAGGVGKANARSLSRKGENCVRVLWI